MNEVHTLLCSMTMSGEGFQLRVGRAMVSRPDLPKRSFGEVESRSMDQTGFPADSFFNVFFEVATPAGLILFNQEPLVVLAQGVCAFPPTSCSYVCSNELRSTGQVKLYNVATGCLAGWLLAGKHLAGPAPDYPSLGPPPTFQDRSVVFSVDGPAGRAEGLRQPDPCSPLGHPAPNDVFALGPAAPARNFATEGELFQSPGDPAVVGVDATNRDRISASLGVGPGGGPPPYTGPFSPNSGAPPPSPTPPVGPGALGLVPGDDVDGLSFGMDGGDVLIFSVSSTSTGVAGSAVRFESVLSPPAGPIGTPWPSNGGGDAGKEAAGDLYFGTAAPPLWFGEGLDLVLRIPPLPPGTNSLALDEVFLGLQAPGTTYSAVGPPEDNLDALEIDDASHVDANGDGLPEAGVYFTLHAGSPTIGLADPLPGIATGPDPDGVTADDILLSPPPGFLPGTLQFAIFARGVVDIGLLPADDVDALALYDAFPFGELGAGDVALFSLAAGSPSLGGVNPNMPGAGPFSGADVFSWAFGGGIGLYASAATLGLLPQDEIDALDIGWQWSEDSGGPPMTICRKIRAFPTEISTC